MNYDVFFLKQMTSQKQICVRRIHNCRIYCSIWGLVLYNSILSNMQVSSTYFHIVIYKKKRL